MQSLETQWDRFSSSKVWERSFLADFTRSSAGFFDRDLGTSSAEHWPVHAFRSTTVKWREGLASRDGQDQD